MSYTAIPDLLFKGVPVYTLDAVSTPSGSVTSAPPVATPTPQVDPIYQKKPFAFRQKASFFNGSRTISSIVVYPSNGWVVEIDIPAGQNNILRFVVAEIGGGPGVKHVDVLDAAGNVITSGDATPGTVTLYVDTANHGYGYPSAPAGNTYFIALTVPTQNEYTQAYLDIQFAA